MTIHNIRVFDESIKLADNAMLRHKPELFNEWNFEKNDDLRLDVYSITRGSGKKAWWNCFTCHSIYDAVVEKRVRRGQSCPYCAGVRVNNTNSLAKRRPDLAKEWHPAKNGDLTPDDVTTGSDKVVWWLGECNHSWRNPVSGRHCKGTNCPICCNREVLKGFNDMWTTSPETASKLLNSEDGYKYTQRSDKKLNWLCNECRTRVDNISIKSVRDFGLSCPSCSDGVSYNEKFVYNFLKQTNLNFTPQKRFNWSNNRIYDFYLKDLNTIIEVHGEQHYRESFGKIKGSRSLLEEKRNDEYKKYLASSNGITRYIVINAEKSSSEWLRESIMGSDLSMYSSEVDFALVEIQSLKSLVNESCLLWNNGNRDVKNISNILGVHNSTVRAYLKKGKKLGWCDYCPLESSRAAKSKNASLRGYKIVQLVNGDFLSNWNSASVVERELDIKATSIYGVCKGRRNKAGKYQWMYENDYIKMLKEGLSHDEYKDKYYPKSK